MSARVSTLSYFLQGIIEIRCFKIRDGARMVLFDRDEGGDTGSAGMVWIHMENEHVVRIIYEFPIEKPDR